MSLLNTYCNYFQGLATANKKIGGRFVEESLDRVASFLKNNKIGDALLFLEYPNWQADISESSEYLKASGAFVVLAQHRDGDDPQFREASDLTLDIANQLLSKIKYDADLNQTIVDYRGIRMSAVSPAFVDNVVGWRVEFEIDMVQSICFNPSDWNE